MAVRDWKGLTIRLVAERAGVNESTVYRHFGTEHGLKDAVMRQLESAAGIDLDGLTLGAVTSVAARLVEVVSSHPLAAPAPLDETLTETGRRQRQALVRAVAAETPAWSEAERTTAAAMIDVLWAVSAYERLAVDWGLDRDQASAGITWVLGLVEEAVRSGRRPA
jgi:AcrR family transcriptional regulator